MFAPQATTRQAPNPRGRSQQAIGIETNDDELTLRRDHTLHFAQRLVGLCAEVEAVQCYQRIHTITFQGQLLGGRDQTYFSSRRCRYNTRDD